MDLRDFFKRVRDVEAAISDEYPMVVSYATPDGGKAGITTETPRSVAATLIAEGRARLATPEEAAAHQQSVRNAVEQVEKAALADKIQVALVTDADLEGLKQKTKTRKG
ncbi:MAG TPA: hypothetical protein VGL53_15110 [Bryobacteraceae bacterium]|jgi:hypothetical protein